MMQGSDWIVVLAIVIMLLMLSFAIWFGYIIADKASEIDWNKLIKELPRNNQTEGKK